jgi:signal transduction histidine kinase
VSFSEEKVQVLRADQEECWALLSLFPISYVPGHTIGLVTLVDITRQKRVEDAKTQFVSLASHQLRTPIAGMKWSTELLQMDNPENLSDRQRKYIDRLLLSVHRMARLVDDFLRVSRFELGTFVPELTQFDPRTVFEEVLLEQAVRVEQKEQVVKTHYDESVTTVCSDQNLLRMIITNLFSNAVKYTKKGGNIHVGYQAKDDTILISVVDNGMGIPKDDQDRIFTKLFRARNAIRDIPDGTGLGLYIVKEAVKVLKGRVSFTSAEGRGTTFEVRLPVN